MGSGGGAPLIESEAQWRPRVSDGADLFLHLQGSAIEGRNHGQHQSILGNVGIRAFVGFDEEWSRRDPVSGERATNQGALNYLEIKPVQAAILWILAEPC